MLRLDARRILVPLDFSSSSDRALEVAIDVAKRYESAICLLHVFVPPTTWGLDGTLLNFPEVEAAMREQATHPLLERAERVRGAGLVCDVAQMDGRPAETILRCARDEKIDVIVMGTHGNTGLRHALLGSTADRVVQRAPCPVLIVPPEEHTTHSK